MKTLTVLLLVLVAATVRAEPGVSLVPSPEFSVRLAEADQKLEALQGRQSSARALGVVGIVALFTSGFTMVAALVVQVDARGIYGYGPETPWPAALLITSAATLAIGVASFIAAGVVIPSNEEEAAVRVEHDQAHALAARRSVEVAAPPVVPRVAVEAPLSAPPLPAP